jgi:hypothetical protein
MAEEPTLQEIAKEIVEKGLVDKAAEACAVPPETVRGWADGTEESIIPEDDVEQMEGVIANAKD